MWKYSLCSQTMLAWDPEAPPISASQQRQISPDTQWQHKADIDKLCLALELAHPKGPCVALYVFPLPLTTIT